MYIPKKLFTSGSVNIVESEFRLFSDITKASPSANNRPCHGFDAILTSRQAREKLQ